MQGSQMEDGEAVLSESIVDPWGTPAWEGLYLGLELRGGWPGRILLHEAVVGIISGEAAETVLYKVR